MTALRVLRRHLRKLVHGGRWSTYDLDRIVREFGTPAAIDAYLQTCFEYCPDLEAHGTEDHWQDPRQTLALKRGDCEDYAVFACHVLSSAGLRAGVLSLFTEAQGRAVCLAADAGRLTTICIEGLRVVARLRAGDAERAAEDGSPFRHELARLAAERIFPGRWTTCAFVHPEALDELVTGRSRRPFDPRYRWIPRA